MADQLLKELGITGVTLHLNTLGDGDSREAWRAALVEYFLGVKDELSEDSQERLEKNPLRILDSKDRRDRAFVADAPKIDQFLSDDARAILGGGRYDGLMESLGGAPTPAVGWAAGIERLAMLVGDRAEPNADAIVVVENDGAMDAAIAALGTLRRSGLTAELFASGSPRKRFDKAVKAGAKAIVAFDLRDGAPARRIKADDAATARLEALLGRS